MRGCELLPGLVLFEDCLDGDDCRALEEFAFDNVARGRSGELRGKSYVPQPEQWLGTGQGRETVHFGVLCKYNQVKSVNVEPLPAPLVGVLDTLEAAGVFTAAERPDTCCMNAYEEGSWLPPHCDSLAFDRPFFTLSLLSAQEALFGETILGSRGAWELPTSAQELPVPELIPLAKGQGGVRFTMTRGSVLRVDGAAAGPAIQHALPAASSARMSLTFRKLGAAARAAFDAASDAKRQAPCSHLSAHAMHGTDRRVGG